MKLLQLCVLVFFSTLVYSQTKDAVKVSPILNKALKPNTKDYSLYFNTLKLPKNTTVFSSYNHSTNLNDMYTVINGNYVHTKSVALAKNTFRHNKIDSFNPYGSTSIGSALVFGVLGAIIK